MLSPGRHRVAVRNAWGQRRRDIQVAARGPIPPVEIEAPTGRRPRAARKLVRTVRFKAAGAWVNLYLDGASEPLVQNKMGTFDVDLPHGTHTLRFTNDKAYPKTITLRVSDDEPPGVVTVRLRPLPARLKVIGAPDGTLVEVGEVRTLINAHTRGDPIFVPLPEGEGSATFDVVLTHAGRVHRRRLLFRPAEDVVLDARALMGTP